MNFFHNRIANPVSGGPTFQEWLENQFGTKTAGEAKPGLGLDDDNEPRGQQRGQVINNDNEEGAHSYQEGESVDGKKEQGGNARQDTGGTTDQKDNKQKDKGASSAAASKQAKCGKEMGESSDAGKVTEKHTEAAPGDDEHPEPKTLINNDPNYQKGESTNPGKKKSDKKDKSASTKTQFQKISSLNRKQKLALFASLTADQKNLIRSDACGPLSYCEAMVGVKFANMAPEEKEWFKNFWSILYPEEYVTEMVADR